MTSYRAPRMLVVETHPAVEASSISTEGIYSGEYRWDGITAVSEDIALRTPFGSRLQGSIVGKQVKTTRNKTLRSKQTPKACGISHWKPCYSASQVTVQAMLQRMTQHYSTLWSTIG